MKMAAPQGAAISRVQELGFGEEDKPLASFGFIGERRVQRGGELSLPVSTLARKSRAYGHLAFRFRAGSTTGMARIIAKHLNDFQQLIFAFAANCFDPLTILG
jgi:hypothetical protein